MTAKLYWSDSHLTTFTARVVESFEKADDQVVVLDQTAFYPSGGGQPADIGTIQGIAVNDVQILDDGRILHFVQATASLEAQEEVACEVDGVRRREMRQQHTGQHILSQAFFRLFGAETRGFRIADRMAEIDLTLEATAEEIPHAIERAENLANAVVFDDRPIRSSLVSAEEAASLPLRKESFVTDCIRIVEIEDFDLSPCGGTHATRTGEVGLIAIRGWERAKKMVRIEFACGVRALNEYRLSNRVASAVALRFSVARHEVDDSVGRLLEENKDLRRRVRGLAELAAKAEASEMLLGVAIVNGRRIVRHIFEDRDLEELKLLAHRLIENEATIALLATRDSSAAKLVFARSTDLDDDMSALMRSTCERLGGRGGGKPDFAQGGCQEILQLQAAIDDAAESCSR